MALFLLTLRKYCGIRELNWFPFPTTEERTEAGDQVKLNHGYFCVIRVESGMSEGRRKEGTVKDQRNTDCFAVK